MSWRDSVSEELPYLSLGDIEEGDTLEVTFREDGEMTETENGEAFQAKVSVTETPDYITDSNNDPVETGKDYYLMSSSSRFMNGLSQVSDDLTGESVSVTPEGTGFDRTYVVQ